VKLKTLANIDFSSKKFIEFAPFSLPPPPAVGTSLKEGGKLGSLFEGAVSEAD